MAEEVIGSGFSESVKAQFQAREKLFSSKNRTNDQLLYMNSNGAWARLVSSVNTLTAKQAKDLAEFKEDPSIVRGSKNLAYNNVLLGGTKKQAVSNESNYNLKGGVDFTKRYNPIIVKDDQTILEGGLRTSQYNNYNSLGFRPVPGIESVSIESKNTYGTLREAKIKIVAWTLEDLEVIQALYLRPGYSMLLEWGHSMYIEDDRKLNKNGVGTLYNEFLNSPKTSRKIEGDLLKKREDNFNNYDAMYGIVKNFNWSFRQDGGYDCEVILISKGSILESMSIVFDSENRVSDDKEEEQENLEYSNPFKAFFNDINKTKVYKRENDPSIIFTRDTLNNIYKKKYALLQEFYGVTITNYNSPDSDKVNGKCAYIPLRTLLDYYNNYVAPLDNTTQEEGKPTCITRFYTGEFDEDPDTDVSRDFTLQSKYVTSDRHFSIDPGVCLLPKKPNGDYTIRISKKEKKVLKNWGTIWINSAIENKISKQRGQVDDVLNIYLAVPMLLEKLEEIENSSNTQQDMVTYMQKILNEVNDALGDVNDLDLFLDEGRDTWFVVDRKRTPSKELQNTHTTLNLTGLKSTVTDLRITSKISNEISAQVSIAAQGTGGNYKENVSALLKWNSGLIDRTLISKSISKKELRKLRQKAEIKKGQKLYNWFKKVDTVFSEYNANATVKKQPFIFKAIEELFTAKVDYDKGKFQTLKQGHKEFCSEYVLNKYIEDTKGTIPGVIPVELSFKTIGIGGLKIGQAFKIAPGLLPKVYNENFGYILTGLSHDITNNKWETSVKTLFYPLNTDSPATRKKNGTTPETPVPENDAQNIINPLVVDREWWTLVAICYTENFANNYQGYADVAQSIYNRKIAGYFGGSVVANILGKQQYKPVFNNRADWAKISDIDTATTAVYNSLEKRGNNKKSGQGVKNDLIKCAEVLQDSSLKQEAVRFVGTRTEFLASTPRNSQAIGIVERSPAKRNNSFFWRYRGKEELYDKNVVATQYDFKPNDIA